MTTSVLLTWTRDGIGDNDLQVIRDYAIEAPYEWRLALEQLCEIAVKSDTADKRIEAALEEAKEAQTLYGELQTAVKRELQKMQRCVEKLEAGRKDGNLTKGDIDNIAEGMRAAFDQLKEAAE